MISYFLVGGAASITFVTILTRYREQGREEEGNQSLSVILTTMFLVLGAAIVVAEIFAPWCIHRLLPGFDANKAALCVKLTRILLPCLLYTSLGTALYSPTSQIALRLVSREALDEAGWLELLAVRLRHAVERRKAMLAGLIGGETDSCRLCFSEADELPGLVVDKYGGLVVLQLLVKGLDSAAVRNVCVSVLREELNPAAILERPDPVYYTHLDVYKRQPLRLRCAL